MFFHIPANTKNDIINILRTYQDAFIWEEEAPSVHYKNMLKVDLTFRPVCQKHRILTVERRKVAKEEV